MSKCTACLISTVFISRRKFVFCETLLKLCRKKLSFASEINVGGKYQSCCFCSYSSHVNHAIQFNTQACGWISEYGTEDFLKRTKLGLASGQLISHMAQSERQPKKMEKSQSTLDI